MDPVPDPLLLRKSGGAGNRTRDRTPTKYNLYLANSLAVVSEPVLYRLITFQLPNLMSLLLA